MNSFDRCRTIEAKGWAVLEPFLREECDGRVVLMDKGPLARAMQETYGDLIFQHANGRAYAVELKVEAENRTGNLFLESWSNRNLDRQAEFVRWGMNAGWMWKQRADLLFYYFIASDELYVCNMFRLMRWAHGERRLYAYPERKQSKHLQANDTWGYCVPIADLQREVRLQLFHPRQLSLPGFPPEAA